MSIESRSVVMHGERGTERWDQGSNDPSVRAPRAVRRSIATAMMMVGLMSVAPVLAGPWSQLPDAIDRLADRPGDEDAERVLRLVETSILNEAQEGRMAATRTLFDTYASLVSNLPDGVDRLGAIEKRLAEQLLRNGDLLRSRDLLLAASSWTLAAELHPQSQAVDRLRTVLLPPSRAEPGQVWKAPLDGAELVFHPPMTVRLGCTVDDGACLNNEVDIRWFEVPAFWIEAHEVSNRRYRRCVDSGSCTPPVDSSVFDDPTKADHPVVGVSWRQARSLCSLGGPAPARSRPSGSVRPEVRSTMPDSHGETDDDESLPMSCWNPEARPPERPGPSAASRPWVMGLRTWREMSGSGARIGTRSAIRRLRPLKAPTVKVGAGSSVADRGDAASTWRESRPDCGTTWATLPTTSAFVVLLITAARFRRMKSSGPPNGRLRPAPHRMMRWRRPSSRPRIAATSNAAPSPFLSSRVGAKRRWCWRPADWPASLATRWLPTCSLGSKRSF